MLNERPWVKANTSFKTAKRAMENARKAAIPTCPATLEETIEGLRHQRFPPLYQDMFEAVVSQEFRSQDGRVVKHAIILINRAVFEDVVRTCICYGMDGTFKTTPRLGNAFDDRASQVLTISADYHGSPVVIFTVVMQTRKMPLYKKVFSHIQNNYPTFQPIQMMADFEKSMRNGFKAIYKDSRLYGCR